MRSDIIPGGAFPDVELPDHDGKLQRLSELQGGDPMALTLARGGFCPKDHLQHVWMAGMEPEVNVGYARLVTISTDSLLATMEWRSRLGATWLFLSDEKRVLQQMLDIQEYTDPGHDPMIPHTIMLEPGLRIYKVYEGYWYWGRPTPEEMRQDFREMTRRCRPDWSLATPGLRAKWEAGDRSTFFPYQERH